MFTLDIITDSASHDTLLVTSLTTLDTSDIVPMVPAYGFRMCYRMAKKAPDKAVQNPDSIALCALDKPKPFESRLHKRETAHSPRFQVFTFIILNELKDLANPFSIGRDLQVLERKHAIYFSVGGDSRKASGLTYFTRQTLSHLKPRWKAISRSQCFVGSIRA